jgi:hypothetical protein
MIFNIKLSNFLKLKCIVLAIYFNLRGLGRTPQSSIRKLQKYLNSIPKGVLLVAQSNPITLDIFTVELNFISFYPFHDLSLRFLNSSTQSIFSSSLALH